MVTSRKLKQQAKFFARGRRRFRAGVCPELHCIDLIGVSSIGSAPHIISAKLWRNQE
jgi:hypothetical protein